MGASLLAAVLVPITSYSGPRAAAGQGAVNGNLRAPLIQGKVGLDSRRLRGGFPIERAINHPAHFAEPELGDLTALWAPAGSVMCFRAFECYFQLLFHMPATL